MRDRLVHADKLIASAAGQAGSAAADIPAETLTWRVLSSLQVRVLRLEGGDTTDRAHAVSSLVPLTGKGTPADGDALFRWANATGQLRNVGIGNLDLQKGQGTFVFVVKGEVCVDRQ